MLVEHTKKSLTRAELKDKIGLKDRKDPGGRLLSAVIDAANETLKDVFGFELSHLAAAEEGSQPKESQPSQVPASQTSRASSTSKLILLNRLDAVTLPTRADRKVYQAMVVVILSILHFNDDKLSDDKLLQDWLSKLGLAEYEKIQELDATPVELLKRMLSEGYIKRETGTKLLIPGPRARLSVNTESLEAFRNGVLGKRERL